MTYHTDIGSMISDRYLIFRPVGKEVSWRHIQGVYDYSCQNLTAKITRLTKRHVWLTS